MIVFLRLQDVPKLAEVFPSPDFYLPPANTIANELSRSHHGQFNIIHVASGLKADLFTVGTDELHHWAFRNAKKYVVDDVSISLAPPEYVIIRKLEYFRDGGSEKHLRDIRSMLGISGEQIDRTALNDWIQRRSLQPQWKLVCEKS